MVRIAVAQRESLGATADVHVVRTSVRVYAVAVICELRILNEYVSAAREDPILVIVEIPVAHGEIGTIASNSGAVVVWHRSTRELDILDGYVVATDNPDSFPLNRSPHGVHVRPPAHTSQGDTTDIPAGRVIVVLTS